MESRTWEPLSSCPLTSLDRLAESRSALAASRSVWSSRNRFLRSETLRSGSNAGGRRMDRDGTKGGEQKGGLKSRGYLLGTSQQ